MLTFPMTDISSGFDGRIRLLNDLCPITRDDAVTCESLRNYSVSVQRAKLLLPPLLFDCQTSHSTVSFQSGVHTTNHISLSDRNQCCTMRKTFKVDVSINSYRFICILSIVSHPNYFSRNYFILIRIYKHIVRDFPIIVSLNRVVANVKYINN